MNWFSFMVGCLALPLAAVLIRWVIIPAGWGFWLAGRDIRKFRMKYVGKKYQRWYWVPVVFPVVFCEHWWMHASDKFYSFTMETTVSYRENDK